MKPVKHFGIIILFLFATVSEASTYNVSGRIIKNSTGAPLEANNVSFQFEVLNPSGTCLLYRETHTSIDMTDSNGHFSASLGNGTRDITVGAPNPLISLNDIISNRSTNLPCNGGSFYSPTSDDIRNLKISFYDGVSWQFFSQQALRKVPYASQATNSINSEKIGSFTADQLLRTTTSIAPLTATQFANLLNFSAESASSFLKTETDPTVMSFAKTALPTCATGETLKSDGTSFACVTTTAVIPSLSGDITGSINANTVSRIQGTGVSSSAPMFGNVLTFNGVQWTPANVNAVTSITAGPGLDGGTITSSGTISLPPTPVTPGTYGSATTIPIISVDTYGRLVSATTAPVPVTSVAGKSGAVILGYNDIQSATSSYLTYKPNNIACAQGQTLSYDNTKPGWVCATGNPGTVTTVTSSNSYLTVTNPSTTPTITVNVGTAANTVAAGNDSRFTNARAPTGAAGGDLGGNYPSPAVTALNSYPLPTSGYQNGDMLVLNAGAWELRKKNSCAAGWDLVNLGVPFCVKQFNPTDTFDWVFAGNICADYNADLCTAIQLRNACKMSKMTIGHSAWTDIITSPNLATRVSCLTGNKVDYNSGDPTILFQGYCCRPAMNYSP